MNRIHFAMIAAIVFGIDIWMCATLFSDIWDDRGVFFVAVGFVVGVLTGQVALAAMWLAFAAWPLTVRLTFGVVAYSGLLLTWFLGLALNHELPPIEASIFTAGFCTLLFASVATSMWIAQRWMKRTIRALDASAQVGPREQFSIRFVMITTACIAVLLGIGRVAFADQTWNQQLSPAFNVLMPLTLMVLGFGAYVTSLVLPLMGVILGKPRMHWVWLLVPGAALGMFPFLLSEALFSVGGVGRPPAHIYWYVIGSPLVFGFTVLSVNSIGLFAAYQLGYRLQPPQSITDTENQLLQKSPSDVPALPTVEVPNEFASESHP